MTPTDKNTKNNATRIVLSALTAVAVLVGSGAVASAGPSQGSSLKSRLMAGVSEAGATGQVVSGCSSQQVRSELRQAYDRIVAAPDVDAARIIALDDSAAVRRALRLSTVMAPFSDDLRVAAARVDGYERSVTDASTPAQVGQAYAGLVQLASVDNDTAVSLDVDNDGDGCAYSTGETIAIVLGLILGIIPGLILLALLC